MLSTDYSTISYDIRYGVLNNTLDKGGTVVTWNGLPPPLCLVLSGDTMAAIRSESKVNIYSAETIGFDSIHVTPSVNASVKDVEGLSVAVAVDVKFYKNSSSELLTTDMMAVMDSLLCLDSLTESNTSIASFAPRISEVFSNDGIVHIGVFARIKAHTILVNIKWRHLFLQRRLYIFFPVAWLSNMGGLYVHHSSGCPSEPSVICIWFRDFRIFPTMLASVHQVFEGDWSIEFAL